MSIFSCQKKKIEMGTYQDHSITIFGEITNQSKFQFISVVENQSINEEKGNDIKNGKLSIFNGINLYQHNYSSEGGYLSDSIYGLISNSTHQFNLLIGDSTYQSTFVMPEPIIITDIVLNQIDSLYINQLSVNLQVNASSYFKTEVYKGKIDTVLQDTSWVIHPIKPKIYNCINSNNVTIFDDEEGYISKEYTLVKVIVKSLTNKAANYFNKLYLYRQNISTTNQYVNPPKVYFNNAYGCIYGTCQSSYIKAF